jgi:hypothetical protein
MRTALFALLVVLAAGCPKPRSTAATQPTPAAFDPATSDAKALEVVDAGVAAVGGQAAWEGVKELRWSTKYTFKGEMKRQVTHLWDRWNGRHNYQELDIASLASGKPDDVKVAEVRYDMFDAAKKPFAIYDGREISREDAAKAVERAKTSLKEDGYYFTMIHKLKDPGVHLALATEQELALPTPCDPGCTIVKVTFDSTVGKDTWFVAFNTGTKLPHVIASERGGGVVGYQIDGWIDAGGLKFPAKLTNVALAEETWEFAAVKIGEPEDSTYMRNISE